MYVLKFTSVAIADIKAVIPKHLKGPLQKDLLAKVAVDPVGSSHELQGPLAGLRSFTWQEYRVVYRVVDDLLAVAVVGVGLRSPQSTENIYRKLEALARTGELAQGVLFSLRGFTREQHEQQAKPKSTQRRIRRDPESDARNSTEAGYSEAEEGS